MEIGVSDKFWRNKRVLITGHTGFKGSWLSLWLKLWADVSGFSLSEHNSPYLYEMLVNDKDVNEFRGDVKSYSSLKKIIDKVDPELSYIWQLNLWYDNPTKIH